MNVIELKKITLLVCYCISLIFFSCKGTGEQGKQEKKLLTRKGDASIEVFKAAPILFNPKEVPNGYNAPDSNGIIRLVNGRLILKKVILPQYDRNVKLTLKARLVSSGDDYDRSGSIFILNDRKKGVSPIDIAKNSTYPNMEGTLNSYKGIIALADYEPCVEALRFMTPFGVGFYSDKRTPPSHVKAWEKDVKWEADISHLYSLLEGGAYIGAWIDTWHGKGFALDLTLEAKESDQDEPRENWKVASVMNTVPYIGQNYPDVFGQLEEGISVKVNLASAKEAKLYYTTTGHGGNNGDEFHRRKNIITLSGKKIKEWVPWKASCEHVRKWNPTSGELWPGVSSSDLPRSNWCPSESVLPKIIPLQADDLSADSTFNFTVQQANKTIGNDTNFWLISAYVVYR